MKTAQYTTVYLTQDSNCNIEQTNNYFPYGGPWGGYNGQGFQPFKYNGRSALCDASHLKKELDRVHGLDWYDYGARRYDPAYCLFTQMDPLCEDTTHINPFVYCAGNLVRSIYQGRQEGAGEVIEFRRRRVDNKSRFR